MSAGGNVWHKRTKYRHLVSVMYVLGWDFAATAEYKSNPARLIIPVAADGHPLQSSCEGRRRLVDVDTGGKRHGDMYWGAG